MASSPTLPSTIVEWSSHTFCTYTICRASLPARESFHDITTHFTHLPLGPLGGSVKRKGGPRAPERKSSTGILTGRDEWMEEGENGDDEAEVDNELVGMERLTPILSEEQKERNMGR